MTRQLNVLVAESHPGLAASAMAALEAAGHRVHRCYEPGHRWSPCAALQGEPCPLEGPIDVAYLRRLSMTPRPTPLEDGVRCALRRRIPVVEGGRSVLDPFEPFIDSCVEHEHDVVAAVEAAAEHRYEPLRADVLRRIGPLLQAAGLGDEDVTCRIEPRGVDLDVHLELDAAEDRRLDQALGVRTLDAVRAAGRSFGQVDVHVHHVTAVP